MDRTPAPGTEYDWHCPDVGVIRVMVVWHALWENDHHHDPLISGLCRVMIGNRYTWAPVSELHEVGSLAV